MVYSEDSMRTEFSRIWGIYEYLGQNVINESDTSRLLHDLAYQSSIETKRFISKRISEESKELVDAIKEGSDSVIEEGSQLFYWTSLFCIKNGIVYTDIRPDRAMMEGYFEETDEGIEWIPAVYVNSREEIVRSSRSMFAFLGRVYRKADVDLMEIPAYEIAQMQRKPYLQHLFAD